VVKMGQVCLKENYKGNNRKPQLEPSDIRDFFNEQIKKKSLEAFTISEEEKVTEERTENKRAITIEIETILNPVADVNDYRDYLLKFGKKYYLLSIKSRQGFLGSEPKEMCYKYKIRKLVSDFKLKKLHERRGWESPDGIVAPKEDIVAQIIVDYHVAFGEFLVLDTSNWRTYLKKRGKSYKVFKDSLFEQFSQFIINKISIVS